jgi:hypothetical protein
MLSSSRIEEEDTAVTAVVILVVVVVDVVVLVLDRIIGSGNGSSQNWSEARIFLPLSWYVLVKPFFPPLELSEIINDGRRWLLLLLAAAAPDDDPLVVVELFS